MKYSKKKKDLTLITSNVASDFYFLLLKVYDLLLYTVNSFFSFPPSLFLHYKYFFKNF